MTQKSIAMYVVLSIVTCGLFAVYWYYCVATDMYNTKNNLSTTPIITLLLNLVTCGIYGWYAYYQWGKALQAIHQEKGGPAEDRSILYAVLAVCGLGLVNIALIQSELNEMVND